MEKPGRPADDGCPRYRILTTVPKNCGKKGPQIQTVDPGSGQEANTYIYASADPISRLDPTRVANFFETAAAYAAG